MQTLIRRVGTKDGLARAVNEWVTPQVAAARGEPACAPTRATVAAALARHYERWGGSADRTLRQQDASPALAEAAAGGRRAHREWVEAAFASRSTRSPRRPRQPSRPPDRRLRRRAVARAAPRRAASPPTTRAHAVADLIAACDPPANPLPES